MLIDFTLEEIEELIDCLEELRIDHAEHGDYPEKVGFINLCSKVRCVKREMEKNK